MIEILAFISGCLVIGGVWACREYEAWKRFKSFDEQNQELRADNRKLREEKEVLRQREQQHLQFIAHVKYRAGKLRKEFSFDDVPLPAAVNEPVEGQHFSDFAVRETGKLVFGAIAGLR